MSRAKEFLNKAKDVGELRNEDRYFYGNDKDKFVSNFLKVWKTVAGVAIVGVLAYGIGTSEFVTGVKDKTYHDTLLSARLALKVDNLDKSIYPNIPKANDIGNKLDRNDFNLNRIDELMKTGELQKAVNNATGKFKTLLEKNGFSVDRDGENKGLDYGSSNKYKDMRAKKREEALREYLSRNPNLAESVVQHLDANKTPENKNIKTEKEQKSENTDINTMKKKLGM